MISATVGKPGEGKSLTSSMWIREQLNAGHKVATNLHLDESRDNYLYFDTSDWEVIFNLQDGIIVFDEGQFILDSRNWMNLPVEFRQLMQKGRHEGLDFVILTQNIMQVDVSARRLVHEAKKVYKFLSIKRWNFGIFFTRPIDISGLDKEVPSGGFFDVDIIVATQSDWEYYNSYALRSIKPRPATQMCHCGNRHLIKKGILDVPKEVDITYLSPSYPQVIHIAKLDS